MSAENLKIITPVDNSVYAERPLASEQEVATVLEKAKAAQREWKFSSMAEREKVCRAFVAALLEDKDRHAVELAWQIGRPIRYGAGEVGGFEERATYMIDIAANKLRDIELPQKDGFTRFIRREPLGVVLVLPAWNFPYMTAVNSVVPAIMAGNAVVMKHSSQTALVSERFADAFAKSGLPADVFSTVNMSHGTTAKAIQNANVDYVCFTGSVAGGHAIQQAASTRFIGTGLELGGKDPAYVRPDVDMAFAIESIVDGGFFNSGQSCCGKERVYVHEDVYGDFVDGVVDLVKQYKLGDPMDPETTLGPVVKTSAADFVRGQISRAVDKGAKALIDPGLFAAAKDDSPYLAPQVLVDVDHSMDIMMDETFGPAIGIMKVKSDDEAIKLMNDSPFGLTASLWTKDEDAALYIGDRIETGTLFMNRCDYLDPGLAWAGVKDTGKGCTLSEVGYEYLTRPKSFHLRTKTNL